ncbi:unnamed protein product [Zymoseptoria tritici ST99CH_3D1]|uniref:Kinesin-like protein n=2 Tax=Zymoseptoria tritici TaxID=1047171 RepID=A0A1X7RIJ7_ZYMT9|nr:unnamed protein product [Zymoseptoria tritici ST99CH_3D7]SMR45773.1 unnamed protein product [Zymoseptoria tritici ST99CH_1E4]SMR47027.1 unnamed protein product [Zymoseptoria tritici ST99CH_3D1]
MEQPKPSTALFDVFLRLRPSTAVDKERFLDVEPGGLSAPTHITIKPPTGDTRKRAIERFAFTRVFEENAGQRELFETTGAVELIQGVLGAPGREGRDGLLATLGVTGSGKSHTILGSRSQRGLTQLTLDLLFTHTEPHLVDADSSEAIFSSLCHADVSESQLCSATHFLDGAFDGNTTNSRMSRAPTPAMESSFMSAPASKRYLPRISTLPQSPSINDISIDIDDNAEYAIVVSMYEVYNDRIFDLLTPSMGAKSTQKRRALLFKSTEGSPDRKVVAGLRKVVCSSLDDALLVLETGLQERKVAGTGSNAASSRSHGFFCVDVKKRHRGRGVPGPWSSSTMTIVDLAGSERARAAKTAGATLAEAGKINESLMYLGQCMQMQSDNAHATTPNLVPFRQCKLTELLFSNSFPHHGGHNASAHKASQKAIMVVTADPLGDFNATSQILRYSALAREVTVPRIPSVTSTILSGTTFNAARPGTASSGRTTPSAVVEELEAALAELERLRADLEVTQLRLEEETQRRIEAEASWTTAEMRIEDVEAEIRQEVFAEMESQMAREQRRWRAARDEEQDLNDAHIDRKLEIMARGIQVEVFEDAEDEKENALPSDVGTKSGKNDQRLEDLEDENQRLRERLALAEREQGLRSPSKKMRVLKTRKWDGSGMGLDDL